MKVLIVDAHQGTRDKISAMVMHIDPDFEVQLATTGTEAFNIITGETPLDAIITSNKLDGLPGANLLQAIWRTANIPTLLHSSHLEGYMEVADGNREMTNLEQHTALFNFATFRLKDFHFSYLDEFLFDAKIHKLATSL